MTDERRQLRIFAVSGDGVVKPWTIDKWSARVRAEFAKKVHAEAVEIPAVWGGLFYCDRPVYQSSVEEPMPCLGDRDILAEFIPEAHKLGLKVYAYIHMGYYTEWFFKKHPDWANRDPRGELIRTGFGRQPRFCINSPLREYAYSIMEELLTKYDIDGIMTDNTGIIRNSCYCEHCKRKFRERYGAEIPTEEDWSNLLWKKFVQFRVESTEEFHRDAIQRIQRIKPDVLYIDNSNIGPRIPSIRHGGRRLYRIAKWTTVLGQERLILRPDGRPHRAIWDLPIWHHAAHAKYMESAAQGKPYVTYVNSRYTSVAPDWYYAPLPEVKLTLSQLYANGGSAWQYYAVPSPEALLKEAKPVVKTITEFFKLIEDNQEYYTGTESAANVAILYSENNSDFYGAEPWGQMDKQDCERLLAQCFDGFYDLLTRLGLPFDVIGDNKLNPKALEKYNVLVLPNIGCLSYEAVEAIKDFVKRDGGLIATFETSLYDEWGSRRPDFGLADIFHAHYKDVTGPFSNTAVMKFKAEHPVTMGIPVDYMIASPEYLLRVETDGATPSVAMEDLRTAHHAPTKGTGDPTIIAGEYGSGKCVYFPTTMGSLYGRWQVPEYVDIVRNAIGWVVGEKGFPMTAEGVGAFDVTVRIQESQGRILAHLINYTGEGLGRRPIRRMIPLQNLKVRVRIPEGRTLRDVYSLTDKERLRYRIKFTGGLGEIAIIDLPSLVDYEVIVVEYK